MVRDLRNSAWSQVIRAFGHTWGDVTRHRWFVRLSTLKHTNSRKGPSWQQYLDCFVRTFHSPSLRGHKTLFPTPVGVNSPS